MRGMSVYIRFQMTSGQRKLFTPSPSYLPEDVSNLSDVEFVGFVNRIITDAVFSNKFRSELIGLLMKYKGINLRIPRAVELTSDTNASFGLPNQDILKPVPYWNWLRAHNVHIHMIREQSISSSASLSHTWVEPLSTSLLGDDLGRDVLQQQSLDALTYCFLVLVCSLGLVLFLRWQKKGRPTHTP